MRRERRLFVTLVFFFVLLAVGGGLFSWRFFRSQVISNQKAVLHTHWQQLEKQIDLAAVFEKGSLTSEQAQKLQALYPHDRISFITPKGKLFYDSASNTSENLKGTRTNRPEIQAILAGEQEGYALRESPTLHVETLYLATAIQKKNKLIGIVRLSVKYAGFSSSIQTFQIYTLGFVIILLCSLLGMIFMLLRSRNQPVKRVLPILQQMLKAPDKPQRYLPATDEWHELYQVVNDLAAKQAEQYQTFANQQEEFQSFIQHSQIGVFTLDTHLNVTLLNAWLKEKLALPPDVALHQSYLFYFKNYDWVKAIQKVAKSHQRVHIEVKMIKPVVRYLDLQLQYFHSPTEETTMIFGLVYDVTEIRELEYSQKDFIQNVSHELKTPVTSLIGFTETLLDGAKEDPVALTEFLTIMQKDATRLQKLIQQILQLSQTERTPLIEELHQFSPKETLDELIHTYQYALEEKQLQLLFDPAETFMYEANHTLFYAICKNLLENAIFYNHEKGSIKISLERHEKEFRLIVQDTGIGIPEDAQQRIFERFYRVDRARTRNSGGTGLGLAIVSHYVKLLGGTLHLESHLGIGTTFHVTFPLKKD